MNTKTKIAILGIGGVGGYYGGKLAARYSGSSEFDIVFIAKGENGKAIQENGLHLITPAGEQIIHPDLVTNQAEKIGIIDILLCTVKAYDLEDSLQSFENCIHHNTIVLPLLNGVDNAERIQKLFPVTRVWKGCVYIVSRLTSPGIVHETGNSNLLLFGSENETYETVKKIESIFINAGINANGVENITESVWNKFIFLSPIATLTTALNLPVGAIMENELHRKTMLQLIAEIAVIAESKGIHLTDGIVEETINRIEKLPYENYSSMHYDFNRGRKTEIDSLTGYVVKLGKELSIPTPVHDKWLLHLSDAAGESHSHN